MSDRKIHNDIGIPHNTELAKAKSKLTKAQFMELCEILGTDRALEVVEMLGGLEDEGVKP